jgi:hypothetical protein
MVRRQALGAGLRTPPLRIAFSVVDLTSRAGRPAVGEAAGSGDPRRALRKVEQEKTGQETRAERRCTACLYSSRGLRHV